MDVPLLDRQASSPRVRVASSDPHVRYEGRVERRSQCTRFDWPLVAISVRFAAEAPGPVVALLDGAANRFSALLTSDDAMSPVVYHRSVFTTPDSGRTTPILLAHLPGRGQYTLKLCKLTEASHSGVPRLACGLGWLLGMQGVATFEGFELPNGSTVLPHTNVPSRRIEMIGGSDTCGFGADVSSDHGLCSALLRNEVHNAEQCYSAILARRLNAEVHVEAWSGKGIVNNAFQCCGVFGYDPLPALLDRTLATAVEAQWHFQWTPHLVLIDCGGNDYNNCFPTPEKSFVKAYVQMLRQLRHRYPYAVLFNVCGGSTPADHRRNKAAGRVNRAVQRFADDKAVFLEIPIGVVGDNDLPGHFGHHSEVGHSKICDFLEPAIKKEMGWE